MNEREEIERLVGEFQEAVRKYSQPSATMELGAALNASGIALMSAIDRALAERDSWESRYKEEYTIVDRIWKQLGSPTYEQLAGRSIYDLIAERDARIAALEKALRVIANDDDEEFVTPVHIIRETARAALATEKPHE